MKFNRFLSSQLAGAFVATFLTVAAYAGTPPNAQSDDQKAQSGSNAVVTDTQTLPEAAQLQIKAFKADKASWTGSGEGQMAGQ